MTFVEEDFRCQVLWCTTKCVGSAFHDLREPEICEFEVPIVCNQEVLGLEITVDDVLRMEILEHECHLGSIECCMGCFKPSDTAEVGEKLTSRNELEHEVEVPRVLAETFEVDDEWMRKVAENGVLVDDMVHLLKADDLCLLQTLESHILVARFVPGQLHPPERSCAQRLEHLIVC